MRAGIALSELRNEVMIEARFSNKKGHNAFSTDRINQMINRHERLSMVKEEWPTEHLEETVTVPVDAQYADLPPNITYTMIESVTVLYGSEWLPVKAGIGDRERTIYKSTQRAGPILKYEINASNRTQIEIWPVASYEQTLRYSGVKTPGGMVEETDTCTMDADVLVLRVAAELLGADNQSDAQIKLDQAESHANLLGIRQGSGKRASLNLGRNQKELLRPGIDYIPVGGG